ncbi:SRPBCC family protein [Actinokineospora sp.]|uniref:SRPBCC family protein n=1 Tax=Actinokineospora sp. TaxID=1872133 RepID=UPI003D6BBB57
MARIVFETDLAAPAERIVEALSTQKGITGWWTDDVDFPAADRMTLGFAVAPARFELRVDQADETQVRWTSVGAFPPHWANTEITWTLTAKGDSTTVHFAHEGWADDTGPFPSSALTWAQLMGTLKDHTETGASTPLFRRGD